MGTIDDLSRHLDLLTAKAAALPREVATVVAPVLAENVRTVMGDNHKLQDLAESTQIERLAQGYTANDPLVRSGDLRESVTPAVLGLFGAEFAATGSADPIAAYQEFGTATIPARPAFRIGLAETETVARAESVDASVRLLRDT
jgi:phage gpG-like protein